MFGKFLFSACSLLLEDLGSTTRWRPSSTTFNMARHVADAMAFPCRHKNIIISFSHCFGVSSPRSKNLAAKGRGPRHMARTGGEQASQARHAHAFELLSTCNAQSQSSWLVPTHGIGTQPTTARALPGHQRIAPIAQAPCRISFLALLRVIRL